MPKLNTMIYFLRIKKSGICIWVLSMLMLTTLAASAQTRISGTIAEAGTRAPIAGASVNINGSASGAVSNQDGSFSVSAKRGDVLVFSFVGYQPQEIIVGDQSTYDVFLSKATAALDEVVVTGYTAERKKDITGSVAVVDMKSMRSIPTGSATAALQGQASGVNVISSGVPGGGSFVFVRGLSSFGNTSPLVLIDGVQGNLNNVNAEEIESIQVLKDAGSAAIYGVRGANGVIIVTTKKGKAGRTKVTYDAYYGTQRPLPGNPFNLLNVDDFTEVMKTAYPNAVLFKDGLADFMYGSPGGSGIAMAGNPLVDPSRYNLDPEVSSRNYLIQEINKSGTDWFHETFKPAPMTSHTLSASGGSDKSSYLLSLGYFDQQGTLIETYLKRYSVRINTLFTPSKNIRIGENAYVYYLDNPAFTNQGEYAVIAQVYRMMPVIPVYDIRGNYGGTFAGPDLGGHSNPVAIQKRTVNNRNHNWNVTGNVFAEADFLRHFTARTSIGGAIDNGYSQGFAFTPYEASQGNSNPNAYSEGASYGSTLMWTNTLSYSNAFGDHSVKALIGSEAIRSTARSVSGGRQGFYSTDYNYLILNNGTLNISNSSAGSKETLFSLFGRVDYAYADKYLLSGTLRRDGSSRFGSANRFGVFPSVSLGWRLSSESFMTGVEWINDLKLRASYGILGSQNNVSASNPYSLFGGGYTDAYYDMTGTGNSVIRGFYQTRIGNAYTGWEKNLVTNIGVDAAILNNRIIFSMEYFKKAVNGLLFSEPLPATVGGAAAPVVNIGDIQNKGVDVSLTYQDKIGSDLGFSIGANITTYQNKVVYTPDPGYFDGSGINSLGNMVRNQVGQPLSSFFGYEVIGLFRNAEDVAQSPAQTAAAPGRFKYKDTDKNGSITPEDRVFLGSPNPDFTYGLNLGLTYKGFDFGAVFYGSQGAELVNTVNAFTHFLGEIGNKSNVLLNAWTPENTSTNVPKIEGVRNFSTNGAMNSYLVEDGSYFRLRSLILGYTIKPGALKKLGISSWRIYAQGVNLFTITNYSGLDPEIGGSSSSFGIDYGNYPNNQKNFLFGINLSF